MSSRSSFAFVFGPGFGRPFRLRNRFARFPVAKPLNDLVDFFPRQPRRHCFVHEHERRFVARSQAFDPLDRKEPILAHFVESDPELFFQILKRQFEVLRDGDRFWHRRHLTRAELDRVRDVRLSDIIRRNTRIGRELSRDVFYVTQRR